MKWGCALGPTAREVQGERRAETRSSYAEPQPSLAMLLRCIAKLRHFGRVVWSYGEIR